MIRGEVAHGPTPQCILCALLRFGIHRGRSLLLAGAALALCLGVAPAKGMHAPPPRGSAGRRRTGGRRTGRRKVPAVEGEGSSLPGAATEVAVIRERRADQAGPTQNIEPRYNLARTRKALGVPVIGAGLGRTGGTRPTAISVGSARPPLVAAG
jgi:hypothetical protein